MGAWRDCVSELSEYLEKLVQKPLGEKMRLEDLMKNHFWLLEIGKLAEQFLSRIPNSYILLAVKHYVANEFITELRIETLLTVAIKFHKMADVCTVLDNWGRWYQLSQCASAITMMKMSSWNIKVV